MNKNRIIALVMVLAIVAATAIGCEKKSEWEKTSDAAAKKAQDAMK